MTTNEASDLLGSGLGAGTSEVLDIRHQVYNPSLCPNCGARLDRGTGECKRACGFTEALAYPDGEGYPI